jgi:hypothetical protein
LAVELVHLKGALMAALMADNLEYLMELMMVILLVDSMEAWKADLSEIPKVVLMELKWEVLLVDQLAAN